VDISWLGMGVACLLLVAAVAVSWWQGLRLERRLIVAGIRTFVQLLGVGLVIGWIINAEALWPVALAVGVQLVVAALASSSLLERPLRGVQLLTLAALAPTYFAIMALLILLVIQPGPWWEPRIVLTVGGMLLGNSLTAVMLAINRYRSGISDNREIIFAKLALGARWHQAVEEQRQGAASAAVLPIATAMLTAGLVSLPGMMTGQIIAGEDPLTAVKYQVVVMFMLAAATSLATTIALYALTRQARFERVEAES